MQNPKIDIEFLLEGDLPTYSTDGSACLDLKANWNKDHVLWCTNRIPLEPGETAKFPTGIAVAIPKGYVGLICSRSGLALDGVQVANSPGVIDSDYRGSIGILLYNSTNHEVFIEHGQRIAQLMIIKCEQVEWNVVKELPSTTRGSGGFGSTGK